MSLMSMIKAVQAVNICEHCVLYQHQLQCSLLCSTIPASQKLLQKVQQLGRGKEQQNRVYIQYAVLGKTQCGEKVRESTCLPGRWHH